jgi:hypothetical protein
MEAAMSLEVTNVVGRVSDDPGTQAKAIVYLWRTGNLDLLAVLGLDGERRPLVDGRRACSNCGNGVSRDGRCRRSTCYPGLLAAKQSVGDCPICGNRLPGHGVCRRRQACREAARERGESA